MTTRAEEERLRQQEQGDKFIKQMGDMFAQTRADMDQKYIPRPELEARLDHMDTVVERVMTAVEKLTNNVENLRESSPQIFANRAETKQDQADLRAETKRDQADLRTDIAKLETAFDAFKDRGFGWRFEDEQNRYRSALAGSQNQRAEQREQRNLSTDRLVTIGIGIAMISVSLLGVAASIIITLAGRH